MTASTNTIVRTWRATATSAGAAQYQHYFTSTLLPELRKLPGFGGAYLLGRELDGSIELTAHTFWESAAAIRAFAGEDITHSVVEPEARSALLSFGAAATHRDVLVDAR